MRTRTVICVRVIIQVDSTYTANLDEVEEEPAEDYMCTMFRRAGVKPINMSLCEVQDCPFWRTSKFGMVRQEHIRGG